MYLPTMSNFLSYKYIFWEYKHKQTADKKQKWSETLQNIKDELFGTKSMYCY